MSPCEICASFTEEQQTKITLRKRYIKRGDRKNDKNVKNVDEDADLLGDNLIESFGGSHAELEVAAERLFTSPPRPQPLAFEALSLRMPARTVPPTPGTALQQKVQSNLEKSLGSRLDIQIDQKMGAFQASILEAMQNLCDDFQKSLQKSKQVEVDQTSASTSKQNPSHSNLDPSKTSAVELMDVEYGPALPPRLDSYDSRVDDASGHPLSSVEEPSYPDQDHPQHDPDPPYYREVALSDIPSQYAEQVDTFLRILKLSDSRESLPRSSTAVMGLDDEKGRQELRPRGPSSMVPLNSIIKDAFDKFDQDFQAANLPEGEYIKAPPSTAKWYKVGQPCYEDKIQELNTDFAKICISPKPPGAPMGEFPLPILKELEHQARQNISTLNFATRLLLPAIPLWRSVSIV